MSRARNIKPGFFKNEDLAECSAWARLCFIGLWTLADREGRLEDRAKRIKAELFAYDSVEVEPLLADLAARGFILRFKDGAGLGIIQVIEFAKHQSPHFKEAKSVLASPQSLGLLKQQYEDEASGKPQASTGFDADESVMDDPPAAPDSLIVDSLIPDSLIVGKGRAPVVRKRPPVLPKPDDVSEQVWQDWLSLRAKKRAPVTATVVDGARTESGKADMSLDAFLRVWCLRGSQGLEASWLRPDERQAGRPPPESFRERDLRLATERYEQAVGIRRPISATEIIDEVPHAAPRLVGR
jgi:hypothetical protein